MTRSHDITEASDLPEAILEALRQAPRRCPDLAVLAADDSGNEGWALAHHVGQCPRCSAVVHSAAAPATELPEPHRWTRLGRRARALFESPSDSAIRIVVTSIKQAGRRVLQLVDVVGDLVEPVPIRNDHKEGLVVRRTFGDHDLTAHLSAEASGRFTLMLDVWSAHAPSDDVRVTLLRDRREIESVLPRKGRVMFGAVSPGSYRVSVASHRRTIGAIDITFQDAA